MSVRNSTGVLDSSNNVTSGNLHPLQKDLLSGQNNYQQTSRVETGTGKILLVQAHSRDTKKG